MFICNSLAIYTPHIHTGYQGNAPHFSPRQRGWGAGEREQARGGREGRKEGEVVILNTNQALKSKQSTPTWPTGYLKVQSTVVIVAWLNSIYNDFLNSYTVHHTRHTSVFVLNTVAVVSIPKQY